MTEEQEDDIWRELEAIHVPLSVTCELGPQYLRERLFACRTAQDRVELGVQKAKSPLIKQLAVVNAAVSIEKTAARAVEAERLRRQLDDLNNLLAAIKSKQANLIRTSKEIEVLCALGRQAQRLGDFEVNTDFYRPGHGPELDFEKHMAGAPKWKTPPSKDET